MKKVFLMRQKKNKEETYEKIIEMSKNNDCTTGNLLNYEYFSEHYKLIAIDLNELIESENQNVIHHWKIIRKKML